MNYFTKLMERFGKGSAVKTVAPKAPEASNPATGTGPVEGPAEQSRP